MVVNVINDQSGITKGEKSVSFLDCLLISVQHMIPSRQGRYQHHQRRLRQMEVGDQSVQDLKTVTRINENVSPTASGL